MHSEYKWKRVFCYFFLAFPANMRYLLTVWIVPLLRPGKSDAGNMYALTQDRYTFNSRERFSKSAKEGDVKWTVNTNEWRMSSVISPATTVFRLGMRDLTEEKIVFTLPK